MAKQRHTHRKRAAAGWWALALICWLATPAAGQVEAKDTTGGSGASARYGTGPRFNGNLTAWVYSHLRYPEEALARGEEGKVWVRFVVEEDGGVGDIKVVRGVSPELDQAAVEEMVALAMERGVNYYDTAWAYHAGTSETAIGKALAAYPREKFCLANKFPGYDLSNMGKVREMVDTNTIVGQPIHTEDGVTLIPISKVSFGFGGAGGEYGKNPGDKNLGGGVSAGVKITPMAFLIVKEGQVRVMPVAVPAATAVDRVVEMVPDLIDKVSGMVKKDKAEETIEF